MSFYDKKVIYLDYLERGNKIKNGGFVKLEVRDSECRAIMNIRGLYPTDTLHGELYLYARGREHKVDTIMIQYGTGNYASIWNAENMAGSGIKYGDLDGVSIKLSENRILKNFWRETQAEPEEVKKNTVVEEIIPVEPVPEKPVPEKPVLEKPVLVEAVSIEAVPERVVSEKPLPVETKAADKEVIKPIYDDKWKQLQEIYKLVYPFGDNRAYISIIPRDFIILAERYQNLVSNSFLLHGYYNYGHVILGKQENSATSRYFLGVPGIYHEREKQVALMFGFEGFEGASSPFVEGSFGYYMVGVEI